MHKAERDNVMTRLSQADRDHFRHLMQDVRTRPTASRPGDTVRLMLTAHGHTLSPALRTALEAVAARDAMGPQVGAYPPDFCLKRLGTEELVQRFVSPCQVKPPVAGKAVANRIVVRIAWDAG
jgi:hypothetical protein